MIKFLNSREMGLIILVLNIIGLVSNIYSFAVATSIIDMMIRIAVASCNFIGIFMGLDLSLRTKLYRPDSDHAIVMMIQHEIENEIAKER